MPEYRADAKIAIAGTGAAGLAAAHLLGQRYDVTLYEKNAYLGGHTNTIVIEHGPDAGTPVDTGFIVYNDRNYPTFIRFLSRLGITGSPSDMSFSFSSRRDGIEYSSYVPNGLFAQKRNMLRPSFYRMIADILRFNSESQRDLKAGLLGRTTLGTYLEKGNFSKQFMDWYLIPMGAAIWSTPCDEMLDFPAETFLRFFDNHGLLALKERPRWMYVPGGSHTYVRAVREQFSGRMYTNANVSRVRRALDKVYVAVDGKAENAYDYVVIAMHADEALNVLADPSRDERRLLGAWRYTKNQAVLHSDVSAMPKAPRAWASWNYIREDELPGAPVSLTYHMNRLQNLQTINPYFVSLNRHDALAEERVLRRIDYEHPCYTNDSVRTQDELSVLNGAARTFFCGSYFGYGFHEDAVLSGVRVAEHFGVSL
ncbi:MAG: FAD-dependent oxidoreductase [Candidatus Omnitrophota bacterium]|nr:FAD-dependent oxidoreductase [Candidatus Omnitrophota bacterium]